MTASAKFIISADDRTKSAIDSAKRGFKDMERSVSQSAKALKGLFAIAAGVSVMAGFRKVVQANADANKEFADSLNGVRAAAKNLLVSKDGISGMTEQFNELAAVLKDPGTIAAADALISTLVKGAAKVVTGWALIIGSISDAFSTDETELNEQIEKTAKKMIALRDVGRESSYEYIKLASVLRGLRGDLAAMPSPNDGKLPELPEVVVRGSRGGKKAKEDSGTYGQTFTQDAEYWARMKENLSGLPSYFDELSDSVNETLIDATEGALEQVKSTFAEMSVFADEAARNMQTALADFLFDPFANGLKGMLKGFIDVIRRMVAEAAAAKIFELIGGATGVGGALGSIGKLFGFATGGSFKVGGSGGTDSSLVAFKATPGETVDIRTPGQNRSGGGSVVINLDARGSSVESVELLKASFPFLVQQAAKLAGSQMRDDMSRGALR